MAPNVMIGGVLVGMAAMEAVVFPLIIARKIQNPGKRMIVIGAGVMSSLVMGGLGVAILLGVIPVGG